MVKSTDLVFLRDAAALGLTADAILRKARSGELTRIHPGAYLATVLWRELRPEERLLARVLAADRCLGPGRIFTRESAAVVLRIPLLGRLPEHPHILVPPTGPRSTPTIRRTVARLDTIATVTTDGIRTTGPLATAIDIAASRSPLGGVIALSDVQRRLGVTLDELEATIEARRPFPGVRQVERALQTSSAECDSPLESVVLTRCDDLGFERPEQQRAIDTHIGRFWVDFAWEDGQRVLEADGFGKYSDPALLRGRSPADAVIAEKQREDAIRRVVRTFGRTIWDDAYGGPGLERTLIELGVPRIRRARALRR